MHNVDEGVPVHQHRWYLEFGFSDVQGHRHRETRTSVHRTHHACDKSVYTPAFFHQRNQRRDTAFVISRMPKMRKDHLLKRFNLVLQSHQV